MHSFKNASLLFGFIILITPQALMAEKILLKIDSMVCISCVQKIEKNLKTIKEAKEVHANLKEQSATITTAKGVKISEDLIKKILTEAGYKLVSINYIP